MHRPSSEPNALQRPLAQSLIGRTLLCLWMGVTTLAFSATTLGAEVQIRDLEDFDFGTVPATVGDLNLEANVCVAIQPRARYTMTGFGDNASGSFTLHQVGTGAFGIDYEVRVSDHPRRQGIQLQPGIPLTNLRGSRQRRNGRCNREARIEIRVPSNETSGAHPGRYQGTLILTVAPE